MCGIAGIAGPDAAARAAAMGERLIHRGPDDSGLYVNASGDVALAARRLSIIDVPGGHQPIANEDGTVWAVQNGEIYNFELLRRQLAAAGHQCATRCDTEVLVHLYERYGRDLVHALEGMFAFAIWDEDRRRLLLGRDRCGEKPLFVHATRDAVAFASELGALLGTDPGGGWSLDPQVLDAFFTLGYVPPADCLVAGIRQLPPGAILEWTPGSEAVISTYWSAPEPPPRADSRKRAELAGEADELLVDAVASRMISDVPLGLFLSGGLDSSLVAAIARERGEVRTFSVGYDVGDVSETKHAAATARLLGTPHDELILRTPDVEGVALRVLSDIDQPLADQALVPMYALSQHAARSVKVIVGGEGADEFFAGYPRYRWLERAARLRRPGERAAIALAARAWPDRRRRERLSLLAADAGAYERNLAWVSGGRSQLRSSVYGAALRGAVDGAGLAAHERCFTGDRSPQAGAMRADQRLWLPGDVLTKSDRAGMLNSLEIRTPFLSRRLVEFACSLPFETHASGGGKALLRSVLGRRVPDLEPPRKRAFQVPAAQWLAGPLRAYLEHCVNDSRLVSESWFDAGAVRSLAHEHLSGHVDRSGALWPLIAATAWLEGPHGAHVR